MSNKINSKLAEILPLLESPVISLKNTDLNSLITPGVYDIDGTCSNTPELSGGKLIVSVPKNTGYVRQIYIGGYNIAIYTRVRLYANSAWTWGAWYSLSMTQA